jgi:hypothetical protein
MYSLGSNPDFVFLLYLDLTLVHSIESFSKIHKLWAWMSILEIVSKVCNKAWIYNTELNAVNSISAPDLFISKDLISKFVHIQKFILLYGA